MSDLHLKYAPILRFAKGERFFPMRAEDALRSGSLYGKDQKSPFVRRGGVTPQILARYGRSKEVFLRTVDAGPLMGPDVVTDWGKETLDLVYRWAQQTAVQWTEDLARRAYSWFSPKTKEATKWFWWNDLLVPLLKAAGTTSEKDLPRLILPPETRDAAVEQYEAQSKPAPKYAYYYRTVRDGNYLCLQYWFYYFFNDWARGFGGMNDHEGDWEGMLIFFRLDGQGRPQEPPAYVTFVGHHSRLTKPWQHKDVTRVGTHPVGFVAAGSHATYPESKSYPLLAQFKLFDWATGDGPAIEHDQWVHRIALDDVPWLTEYQGSWGTRFWLPLEQARSILSRLVPVASLALLSAGAPHEIELPGVSAPHGPMLGDTGQQRPQWANPVAWAEVPPA